MRCDVEEVLASGQETPKRDDQVLELWAAGMKPRCHNRPPFGPLTHLGDADRGIPPKTWQPTWDLMGCGAFADLQDVGNGPLPLPVRENWNCDGCRWRPADAV